MTTPKLVIMTEEAYQTLNDKLDSIIKSTVTDKPNNQEEWLTNNQVMTLLNVSKSTLQSYRDKGLITFSQIGRKILYKSTEVNAVLDKFKVPSYKTLKNR